MESLEAFIKQSSNTEDGVGPVNLTSICLTVVPDDATQISCEAPQGLRMPGTATELLPQSPPSLPGHDSQCTPAKVLLLLLPSSVLLLYL